MHAECLASEAPEFDLFGPGQVDGRGLVDAKAFGGLRHGGMELLLDAPGHHQRQGVAAGFLAYSREMPESLMILDHFRPSRLMRSMISLGPSDTGS